MANIFKYIVTIVWRDFKPLKNAQNKWQHFFQCQFPPFMSVFIIFVLCMIGLSCLGIREGLKNNLVSLKKDPFASAVKVENLVKPKEVVETITKENLYLIDQNNKKIPVVRSIDAGYYNDLHFIRLNQNGKYSCPDTRDKISRNKVVVIDHTNEKTKQSIIKKLRYNNYFEDSNNKNNLNGIIITGSLYKKLGYKLGENGLPDEVMFLTNHLKCDPFKNLNFIKETNNGKDFQPKHIMRYTISIPLLDVAEKLPHGAEAIITEEYYNKFLNYMYCPCRKFNQFYIKGSSTNLNKRIKNDIESKAKKEFEDYYDIGEIIKDENMIEISLLVDIPKWQIEQKIKKIKKSIQIDIEPEYVYESVDTKKMKNYDYVYIYLHNDDFIINNIHLIRDKLYKNYNFYINEHQINTLKRLQYDLKNMNKYVSWAIITIGLLLLLFLIIFINMYLQSKIHKLGVLKSMGASKYTIFMIYIIEAFILVVIPLAVSFLIIVFLILCFDKTTFHLTVFHFIIFFIFTIFISFIGASLGISMVVNQVPYRIISYRS